MTYEPKKGDLVKVTIEGKVNEVSSRDIIIGAGFTGGTMIPRIPDEHIVTFEKIEPPAVQFKPGDVVRGKDSGFLYALGISGYTNVGGTNPGATFAYGSGLSLDYFTSRHFEKVYP